MSDTAFYWIGVIHVAVYMAIGIFAAVLQLVAWTALWVNRRLNFIERIMQWHIARARWNERHERGLTDDEWNRGEPKP